MFSKKCYKGGKRHNFQPRYTEKPMPMKFGSIKGMSANGIKKLFVHNIYVHDVCTWCGKVIKPGGERHDT